MRSLSNFQTPISCWRVAGEEALAGLTKCHYSQYTAIVQLAPYHNGTGQVSDVIKLSGPCRPQRSFHVGLVNKNWPDDLTRGSLVTWRNSRSCYLPADVVRLTF